MDRIKQALQKSRQRSSRSQEVKSQPVKEDELTELPFANIEYNKSRRVSTPQAKLSENRLIAGNKSDPRATAFRLLRTQVLHAMRENGWTSVAVTGPTSGVGKSLIAANLAVSICKFTFC